MLGLLAIGGGLSAMSGERGAATVLLPILGLAIGAAFLRGAWKIFGE